MRLLVIILGLTALVIGIIWTVMSDNVLPAVGGAACAFAAELTMARLEKRDDDRGSA